MSEQWPPTTGEEPRPSSGEGRPPATGPPTSPWVTEVAPGVPPGHAGAGIPPGRPTGRPPGQQSAWPSPEDRAAWPPGRQAGWPSPEDRAAWPPGRLGPHVESDAGGPSGPTPGSERSGRGGRIVVAILLLLIVAELVVVALLAFVTGPRFARTDVLDPAAVERGVARVVTDDWRHAVTGVGCPEDIPVRAGTSFRCTATVDGRPQTVPVDVLDARGTYQVGQPR